MAMSPEDRSAMIAEIVKRDIEINGGDGDWYLHSLLIDGFKGYAQYTNDELRETYESVVENDGIDLEDRE